MMHCEKCNISFNEEIIYCPNCGNMCSAKNPGKGLAVFSFIMGILNCHYALTMGGYTMLMAVAEHRFIFSEHKFENFIMQEMLITLIFVVAAISLIFGFVSQKKGNNSKIRKVGMIMSIISLSVSIIFYILLKI